MKEISPRSKEMSQRMENQNNILHFFDKFHISYKSLFTELSSHKDVVSQDRVPKIFNVYA